MAISHQFTLRNSFNDLTTMIYVASYPIEDRISTKSSNQNESMQKSFRFLIKLSNFLGILPINLKLNKFNWKSWKCFYTYTLITIFIINTIFCVMKWTFYRFSFRRLAKQMHQINGLISLILYLRLAQKWPKLTKNWCNVDNAMNSCYGYPKCLKQRIKIATIMIFIAALGEYLLLRFYEFMRVNRITDGKFEAEAYYLFAFSEIFEVLPYNEIIAVVVTVTSLIGHLIWSFNDLFIILISSALAVRFKQITDRLQSNEKKANSNEYWIEIRADYDRLVHLSKKLDKYISYIVLLSYSANIFFLLIQLSNVIGHFNNLLQIYYYSYSFTFLIARLVTVSLYGAWISDESKEPANSLNSVPSATYNLEIRRFLLQISFNDVALTGSKMFKVTRGLLLSVAGAIVTYELVMIQFNDAENST